MFKIFKYTFNRTAELQRSLRHKKLSQFRNTYINIEVYLMSLLQEVVRHLPTTFSKICITSITTLISAEPPQLASTGAE